MTQRTNYERFVHHGYLSDVNTQEDHVNVPPIEQFQDAGCERHVVTNYDEWDEIIANFKRRRRLKEQGKYDLSEE